MIMQQKSIYNDTYKPQFISEMNEEELEDFLNVLSQKLRQVKLAISKANLGQAKFMSFEEDKKKKEYKISHLHEIIKKDFFHKSHKIPFSNKEIVSHYNFSGNKIVNTNQRFVSVSRPRRFGKSMAADMICDYEGATETLANRIINKYDKFYDITEFIEEVKDKSNTYKAISRVIFHIILDHKTKDAVAAPEIKLTEIDGMKIYSPDDDYYDASVFSANDNTAVPYVRILAMDEKGQEYLNSIKKTCPVPIITKTAGYEDLLKDDIYAADIYNLAVWKVFGNEITGEFQKGIYIKGQGFTGSEA